MWHGAGHHAALRGQSTQGLVCRPDPRMPSPGPKLTWEELGLALACWEAEPSCMQPGPPTTPTPHQSCWARSKHEGHTHTRLTDHEPMKQCTASPRLVREADGDRLALRMWSMGRFRTVSRTPCHAREREVRWFPKASQHVSGGIPAPTPSARVQHPLLGASPSMGLKARRQKPRAPEPAPTALTAGQVYSRS